MKSVYVGPIPTIKVEEGIPVRSLGAIAEEIRYDWVRKSKNGVNYAAKPYLDAMHTLESIDDSYYADSGRSIVAYFLANASSWRGDVAKRIKGELKGMIDK